MGLKRLGRGNSDEKLKKLIAEIVKQEIKNAKENIGQDNTTPHNPKE